MSAPTTTAAPIPLLPLARPSPEWALISDLRHQVDTALALASSRVTTAQAQSAQALLCIQATHKLCATHMGGVLRRMQALEDLRARTAAAHTQSEELHASTVSGVPSPLPRRL